MNKYLIITIIALLCVILAGHNYIDRLQSERDRLEGNQAVLLDSARYYRTESERNAASVQRLLLTKDELNSQCNELLTVIDDLNLKLKRVNSISTTATTTEASIRTEVRDSILRSDTTWTKIHYFRWKDPWLQISGIIHPNRIADILVTSRDTLHQVIHRVPKKFWFIKFGCKAIRQEITNSNPHSNIVYSRYVELKK